jgi:hypothetical protein
MTAGEAWKTKDADNYKPNFSPAVTLAIALIPI